MSRVNPTAVVSHTYVILIAVLMAVSYGFLAALPLLVGGLVLNLATAP